jgi:hypothetical protein
MPHLVTQRRHYATGANKRTRVDVCRSSPGDQARFKAELSETIPVRCSAQFPNSFLEKISITDKAKGDFPREKPPSLPIF